MVRQHRPQDDTPPTDSTPTVDASQLAVESVNRLSDRIGGLEQDVSEIKGWFKAFLWAIGIILTLLAIISVIFFQVINLILRYFDLIPKS